MIPPLVEKILRSDALTEEELLEKKGSIYTFLNPVSYLNAQKEKDLFQAFDGIFADGSLLVKAIRLLYGKKVTRRSFDMTSLAPVLLRYALQEGKRVAIIASKQEEVEQAVDIIRDKGRHQQAYRYLPFSQGLQYTQGGDIPQAGCVRQFFRSLCADHP